MERRNKLNLEKISTSPDSSGILAAVFLRGEKQRRMTGLWKHTRGTHLSAYFDISNQLLTIVLSSGKHVIF